LISSGIDLDDRLKNADTALAFFEQKIALIVGFGKAIPGFKSLPLDDQASLIKGKELSTSTKDRSTFH